MNIALINVLHRLLNYIEAHLHVFYYSHYESPQSVKALSYFNIFRECGTEKMCDAD